MKRISKIGYRKYKVKPKVCIICGTVFEKGLNESYKVWETRKYCSEYCNRHRPCSEEKKKSISEGNTGRKQSPELIERRIAPLRGQKRTQEQRKTMSIGMTGKKRPPRTKEALINMSLGQTGEKEFTGFKQSFQTRLRHLKEYNEWRLMIFGRDDFTCQKCGVKGVYLNAHHIKLMSVILIKYNIKTIKEARNCKELWDINNGVTLCVKCHKKIHKNSG